MLPYPCPVLSSIQRSQRVPASRPWAARLSGLALVIALLGLLVPAGASAMSKGLMDEELARSEDQTLRDAFFTIGQGSNVKFTRTFINWDGKFAFPYPHEIERAARVAREGVARGVDTVFVSFNGELGTHYNDAKKVNLKRFRTMVERSAREMHAALKGVDVRLVWSPWNEANYQTQLPKKNGPATWRKMQNAAYAAVKKVAPKDLVVAGELAPYARSTAKSSNPGPFLRSALGLDKSWRSRKGTRAKDYSIKADAITLHSYDYLVDPRRRLSSKDKWTIRNLATTRSLLKRAARTKRIPGSAVKRLYITEFAYIFKPVEPTKPSSQTIADETGATWLKYAWDIAKRNQIRGFLWFNVRDPQAIFFSGLVDANNRARPALAAFQALK